MQLQEMQKNVLNYLHSARSNLWEILERLRTNDPVSSTNSIQTREEMEGIPTD